MHRSLRLNGGGLAAIALALGLWAGSAHVWAESCIASAPATEIRPDEANRLYECIEGRLLQNLAGVTGVPGVPDYRGWRVVSTSPLVSATHGSMMVNHIVNPLAESLYIQWEGVAGRRFPKGSIVAKESFRITRSGEVRAGPLFMMEKAAEGVSPATDDWMYTRIFANGRVQRTLGPEGDRLAFCHDCHSATIKDFDAMFFPPEEFRTSTE